MASGFSGAIFLVSGDFLEKDEAEYKGIFSRKD